MINSLITGRCGSNFKSTISDALYRTVAWAVAAKLFLVEYWLGAVMQQAMT